MVYLLLIGIICGDKRQFTWLKMPNPDNIVSIWWQDGKGYFTMTISIFVSADD